MTTEDITINTKRDPTLAKVYQFVLQGWPLQMGRDLKPYMDRKDELPIEQDCLMWGVRVVVPKKLEEKVLEELHNGHIGVIMMKSLARSHIWWPGIDKDIEEITRSCEGCLLESKVSLSVDFVRNQLSGGLVSQIKLEISSVSHMLSEMYPSLEPIIASELPDYPWQKVGADLFELEGVKYLLLVDYFSRLIGVVKLKSTTSTTIITVPKIIFSRYGIPERLM